jgi:hypothetical protein
MDPNKAGASASSAIKNRSARHNLAAIDQVFAQSSALRREDRAKVCRTNRQLACSNLYGQVLSRRYRGGVCVASRRVCLCGFHPVSRRDRGTTGTLGGELFINLKILNTLQSRQTEQAKHDDRDQHGSDSQC